MITSWDELPAAFPGLPGSDAWLPLLKKHAELLMAASDRVKTTSVDPGEMVGRHYAESLELLRLVMEARGTGPVIDVGPGGGFPGLVIAAVHTDWPVALVEPIKKRAALLEEMAAALALTNVEAVALRAEEAGRTSLRESGAVVTARAVAPLPELLEYCLPLASVGGLVALPKGRGWEAELETAANALSELRCDVESVAEMRPEVSATPVVVLVRKREPTPERYPRRAGIPRKRPL